MLLLVQREETPKLADTCRYENQDKPTAHQPTNYLPAPIALQWPIFSLYSNILPRHPKRATFQTSPSTHLPINADLYPLHSVPVALVVLPSLTQRQPAHPPTPPPEADAPAANNLAPVALLSDWGAQQGLAIDGMRPRQVGMLDCPVPLSGGFACRYGRPCAHPNGCHHHRYSC